MSNRSQASGGPAAKVPTVIDQVRMTLEKAGADVTGPSLGAHVDPATMNLLQTVFRKAMNPDERNAWNGCKQKKTNGKRSWRNTCWTHNAVLRRAETWSQLRSASRARPTVSG